MLNKITAKGPLNFQSDLGQYNVIKKHLQLWFNSNTLRLGETNIVIKGFDFPEDAEKLELIDSYTDARLTVPIPDFKATFKKGIGYIFPFKDWVDKYEVKPVRLA